MSHPPKHLKANMTDDANLTSHQHGEGSKTKNVNLQLAKNLLYTHCETLDQDNKRNKYKKSNLCSKCEKVLELAYFKSYHKKVEQVAAAAAAAAAASSSTAAASSETTTNEVTVKTSEEQNEESVDKENDVDDNEDELDTSEDELDSSEDESEEDANAKLSDDERASLLKLFQSHWPMFFNMSRVDTIITEVFNNNGMIEGEKVDVFHTLPLHISKFLDRVDDQPPQLTQCLLGNLHVFTRCTGLVYDNEKQSHEVQLSDHSGVTLSTLLADAIGESDCTCFRSLSENGNWTRFSLVVTVSSSSSLGHNEKLGSIEFRMGLHRIWWRYLFSRFSISSAINFALLTSVTLAHSVNLRTVNSVLMALLTRLRMAIGGCTTEVELSPVPNASLTRCWQ